MPHDHRQPRRPLRHACARARRLAGIVLCAGGAVHAQQATRALPKIAVPAPALTPCGAAAHHADSLVRARAVPSLTFAVVRDGRLHCAGAAGFADAERRIPTTIDTPYALASVTKPLVATAAMSLVAEGRLDLDAPVAPRLPTALGDALREAGSGAITLRQLLTHTAGLGTYARIDWTDMRTPRPTFATEVRRYGRPMQPPGAVSEYSNLGYGLVGALVAHADGRSLGRALAARVLDPLGMRDSWLESGDGDAARSRTAGRSSSRVHTGAMRTTAARYAADGTRLPHAMNNTPGAGNAVASARDLAWFGAFHLGMHARRSIGRLSPVHVGMMQSASMPGARHPYYDGARYAFGWYVREHAGSDTLVWHEGGMPGASALLLLLPRHRTSIAVLVNATDANGHIQRMANLLAGAVVPAWSPAPFDAAAGFEPFDGRGPLVGTWDGEIEIPDGARPVSMTFPTEGRAQLQWVHARESGACTHTDSATRSVGTFTPLRRKDLVLGTVDSDVIGCRASAGVLTLLRLRIAGDSLVGAAVSYGTLARLEHLYPYRMRLARRVR